MEFAQNPKFKLQIPEKLQDSNPKLQIPSFHPIAAFTNGFGAWDLMVLWRLMFEA